MANKKEILNIIKSENNINIVINALEEVRNNEYVKNIDLFEHDFQRIIDRLLDDSFRLAVVGEFSSGKSTFLNALIGKDLLKHGAKETTATITEIHNQKIDTDDTYLDVYFLNGDIELNVSPEKIIDYTATASTTHAVAQEIEKVVIKSKILKSDEKVCFVDTPGLNGIADNHREKTIEQIKNAHACIYLMQVRGLGQSDIEFLRYISKYQHNIIFVQNFIDELKKLEGETPEQKVQQQKKIIEEKIISENRDIHYEIIAVSSRKALIAKSYDFKTYNGEELTEELRDALYEQSCFDDVFSVINNLMTFNVKEKTQQKDTVSVALNLLEQLRELVSFKNEKEIDAWETSVEGRNSLNYTKLIEALNENKQSYIQKLHNYLEAETCEIRKENNREICEGLQHIENSVKNIFSEIGSISEFECYVREQLSVYLYQNVTTMDETAVKHMNTKFENMVSNAILRIKQYTGTENAMVMLDKFEATIIESEVRSFAKEEDDISKLERELSEKKALDQKADKDIQSNQAEISRIDFDIENQKKIIDRENSNKSKEISRLGVMPEKETKYRKETYYEYRGGLGILDALFGPKEKTRMVPYKDDTNQQRWKKQKSEIETKYRTRVNEIEDNIRRLDSKKKQYDEDIEHLKKTEPTRKKSIQRTQSLLEAKMNYLNKQKKQATQEYLKNAKNSVMNNIHQYLYEAIYDVLDDNSQNAIEENSKRASQVVMSLFEVSFETRMRTLEQKLEQINGTNTYDDTADLLSKINNSIKKMEEFLCQ